MDGSCRLFSQVTCDSILLAPELRKKLDDIEIAELSLCNRDSEAISSHPGAAQASQLRVRVGDRFKIK